MYDKAYKVKMGFRILFYFEGEKWLEFPIEKDEGKPPRIILPLEKRWKSEMPQWARDRREEIVERMRQEPWQPNYAWEEN